MSERKWPHFPEDQLLLPGVEDMPIQRRDDERSTRVESVAVQGRTLCKTCGEPKTIGMPCEHCRREK